MYSNYSNNINWPTFDYVIYKISYLAWVTVRIGIKEDSMKKLTACNKCKHFHEAKGHPIGDVCLADTEELFDHRTGKMESVVVTQTCFWRNNGDCKKFKVKEVKP